MLGFQSGWLGRTKSQQYRKWRSSTRPSIKGYQIQSFIIRISVTVCWFQFACRTFIFCGQNELSWKRDQTKTYQMVGPSFKWHVSVYDINKIIHGRLLVWNLSWSVLFDLPRAAYQIEHEKINSISPRTYVLFSICRIMKLIEFY